MAIYMGDRISNADLSLLEASVDGQFGTGQLENGKKPNLENWAQGNKWSSVKIGLLRIVYSGQLGPN